MAKPGLLWCPAVWIPSCSRDAWAQGGELHTPSHPLGWKMPEQDSGSKLADTGWAWSCGQDSPSACQREALSSFRPLPHSRGCFCWLLCRGSCILNWQSVTGSSLEAWRRTVTGGGGAEEEAGVYQEPEGRPCSRECKVRSKVHCDLQTP